MSESLEMLDKIINDYGNQVKKGQDEEVVKLLNENRGKILSSQMTINELNQEIQKCKDRKRDYSEEVNEILKRRKYVYRKNRFG